MQLHSNSMGRRVTLFAHLIFLATPFAVAQWSTNPNINNAISTATGNQQYAKSVSDGAGGAIITWQDLRSGTYSDIYAQRINASGAVQWTANGVTICTAAYSQYTPTITSDNAGGAIITWMDFRNGTTYDIYAQRINASGVVQWTADGVAICTAAYAQLYPTITSDNSGGAIITWQDFRGGTSYDIYAQRINAGGVVQWIADGVAICIVANEQAAQTITSDNVGGAIITWRDYRSVTSSDIYAQRINAGGVVQWTANGVAICTAAGYQDIPTITSDPADGGTGGAIITWEDSRSGNYDIYAQRINASGVVQWTANGVAICTAASHQFNPTITSDPADGGTIITWKDARNGLFDIYAQRINAGGVVQWTADGVAICTAASDQFNPIVISDPANGGTIITWEDYRSGNYDIYAQRVNAGGVVQWAPNGVAISTASGDQVGPTIVVDGAGVAIIAWEDGRPGTTTDIYAQKVDYNGYLGNAAPTLTTVQDVPGDQGGRVSVGWNRSYLDAIPNQVITYYSIWRGIRLSASLLDESSMTLYEAVGQPVGSRRPDLLNHGGPAQAAFITPHEMSVNFQGKAYRRIITSNGATNWEWLANAPAHYLANYVYTAPTTSDSTASGTPYFKFFVSAHTSNQFVFWDSNVDSGYSKDNLPPFAPANASLVALSSTSNRVTWDRNRIDTDVGNYYVYRSTYSGFPVTDSTRIAILPDTTFLDAGLNPAVAYIYRVTTVDVHGNQSVPTGEIALSFSQSLANGWNMISLPSNPSNAYYQSLYPSAVTGTLYGYNNGYYSTDTLRLGKGYWMKSSSSSSAAVGGSTVSSQSLSLANGWNMIGGISCAVPKTSIIDPAGIIVAGTLYGFNNGYAQADTMKRGKGYWIRTRAAGTIWLNCGRAMAKLSTENVSTSFPTLEIQDVTGASQTLCFNVTLKNPEENLSYSLPGLPPSGTFDARFSGDSRISETESGVIQLQSSSYPVTITAGNLASTALYSLTELRNGVEGTTHALANGASFQITNPEVKTLRLWKEAQQSVPLVFALEQNYPNPFNPSTTIKFSVEKTDRATVEVYNVLGEKVMTLFDEVAEAGQFHQIRFDGTGLASGVYMYRLQSGKRSELKKLVLLK